VDLLVQVELFLKVNAKISQIFRSSARLFKEGHPEQKSRWWKIYTLQRLLECTKEYATEVKDITQLQEYDVIMFKSEKSSPLHFGMYIGQNMMIHIEEKSYSRIDMLNQDWREKIYGVYRRKVV
jgi:cell wall-associated NlpC family hydrolase